LVILHATANERIPFSGARSFIKHPSVQSFLTGPHFLYVRPITHELPQNEISLSDKQSPGSQLRFYTKERVTRGWRYLGQELGKAIGQADLIITGNVHEADQEFFAEISRGGVRILWHAEHGTGNSVLAEEDRRFNEVLFALESRTATLGQLQGELERLLACGDSWTALDLSRSIESQGIAIDASLASSMALAYGLQGWNDDSERLFRKWEDAGTLDAARARYSLAMLYARHHDSQRRSQEIAEEYLQSAYSLLNRLPESAAVNYEKVFNRNGYALLLFRNKQFSEAALLLEEGIASLTRTELDGQLHKTVLLNNLGRVYGAMGRMHDAEKALGAAVDLDPLFAEYHQDLASLLIDLGDLARAREEARAARDLDPAIMGAHELLGFACEHLGLVDEAVASYRAAFDLGSTTAGLALLRALSAATRYHEVLDIVDLVAAAHSDGEDLVECRLVGVEALSLTDAETDFVALLEELAVQHPDSPLIAENIKMARRSVS